MATSSAQVVVCLCSHHGTYQRTESSALLVLALVHSSLSQEPPYTMTSFGPARAPSNSFTSGTRHSWHHSTQLSDSCTVRSALTQQPICCNHDQPSQTSYRPSQPTEVPAANKANYNRRAHTRDTPRTPRSGDKGDCAMGPTWYLLHKATLSRLEHIADLFST